jgi:hypothetical protein
MARRLKQNEAVPDLSAQVAATGAEIREKYGPRIGWPELTRLLADRKFVRYPCEIEFSAEPLLPGEFAHAVPKGPHPEDGYAICVHPFFANQLDVVPHLVLNQIALVNYGPGATPEDAETFGSLALGMSKEDYYSALCRLAAQIRGGEPG